MIVNSFNMKGGSNIMSNCLEEKRVSIVIPVYNVGQYLPKCLNTIINQTYKNLEVILVDDGSTDESGLICDSYAKKDDRISVIHKSNGGVSTARNAGIDVATGNYIHFVDPDDYIHPQMFEILVELMQKYSADISVGFTRGTDLRDYEEPDCGNYSIKVSTGKELLLKLYSYDTFDFFGYNDTCILNKLYKKELFSDGLRFDEKARRAEDITITPYLLDGAEKIVSINRRLYYVYHRKGSLTRQDYTIDIKRDLIQTSIRMYKNRLKYFSDKGEDYKIILEKIYQVALYDLMTQYRDYGVCKKLIRQSFYELFDMAKNEVELSPKQLLAFNVFKNIPVFFGIYSRISKLLHN